jgi:hypothetical protein
MISCSGSLAHFATLSRLTIGLRSWRIGMASPKSSSRLMRPDCFLRFELMVRTCGTPGLEPSVSLPTQLGLGLTTLRRIVKRWCREEKLFYCAQDTKTLCHSPDDRAREIGVRCKGSRVEARRQIAQPLSRCGSTALSQLTLRSMWTSLAVGIQPPIAGVSPWIRLGGADILVLAAQLALSLLGSSVPLRQFGTMTRTTS